MSTGSPAVLAPQIAPVVEIRPVTFDFGPALASMAQPVSITSIVAVHCTVVVGVDPDAASRIIGSPAIVPSNSQPAMENAAIVAHVGTMLAECVYLLQAVAGLSDGVSQLSIETRLPCGLD